VIDDQLAAWCEHRSGDDIVKTLWEADVPVAKVMQPHRQTELDQLSFRGFFEVVDHPVHGKANFSTVAARLSGGPDTFHARPAPLLGEHNHEVLTELGLSPAEIADLEAEGVIGQVPG
jgi:crotonobetainyl-CoA:carnitine CoA-transferase CaiB-like acyl-CoA transferase